MRRADGAESLLYNYWRSRGSNNSIYQEFIQHDINLFDNTPTLSVSYKFLRCGNRIGVPLSASRSFNPVGAVHHLKLTTRTMGNNPVGAQFSILPTNQVCFSGLGKNQPWSHSYLPPPGWFAAAQVLANIERACLQNPIPRFQNCYRA